MNWLDEAQKRIKSKNVILVPRNSELLVGLEALIQEQNHSGGNSDE